MNLFMQIQVQNLQYSNRHIGTSSKMQTNYVLLSLLLLSVQLTYVPEVP